jgi:hypothetical protein
VPNYIEPDKQNSISLDKLGYDKIIVYNFAEGEGITTK